MGATDSADSRRHRLRLARQRIQECETGLERREWLGVTSMPSAEFTLWWERLRFTGDICPIHLGMTRDEVSSLLGPPDDTGGTSRKHRTPAIWRYGELEFHFGPRPTDPLSLIFLERDGVVR